jgi:hypothetical protein
MTSTETKVIPTLFSHSVKIEQTAKGAMITVHINANNELEAMEQSINLYMEYFRILRALHIFYKLTGDLFSTRKILKKF